MSDPDREASSCWLSASERHRLDTIRSSSRRTEFLVARYALRVVLARTYSGTVWQDWVVSGQENRGPAVLQDPHTRETAPLFLSLAHSADLIAVAASHSPIGVDIEVQRKARLISELMPMVGSAEERRRVDTLSEPMRANEFYRIWTLKEAYFKRVGTGLDFTVIRRLNTRKVPDSFNHMVNGAIWEGKQHTFPYTLAVCTEFLSEFPALTVLSNISTPKAVGRWTCAEEK